MNFALGILIGLGVGLVALAIFELCLGLLSIYREGK